MKKLSKVIFYGLEIHDDDVEQLECNDEVLGLLERYTEEFVPEFFNGTLNDLLRLFNNYVYTIRDYYLLGKPIEEIESDYINQETINKILNRIKKEKSAFLFDIKEQFVYKDIQSKIRFFYGELEEHHFHTICKL